jgi:Arc/MetJ-type ribon-helix-helix transcriptional regulator
MMTIELKPEQERIIEAAVSAGRFHSVEEALDRAIQSIAPPLEATRGGKRQPVKPSLVELFAPLREMDLSDVDFSRNPSGSRPVDFER